MPTLLDASAHNAIIARWAWYAYRDNHVDRHPEDDERWWSDYRRATSAAEAVIDEQTLRLLNGRPAEAPQEYSERLLSELRTALTPYPLQAGGIIRSFRVYLRTLTRGDCDPIHAICANAAEIAIRVYRRRSVKVPPHFADLLCIRLDHGAGRRHSFPSPFRGHAVVTPGCVAECCAGRQHTQTLGLTLATDGFDEDSLSALPFVLFHECISHVMQGPWRSDRESPHPASQFAEGWMDLAAWTVYEQVLNDDQSTTGKLPRLMSYRHRQEMFRKGGSQMYDARHARHPGVLAASSRREGWQAATDTLQAMREFGIPEVSLAFLRLSFHLNASELSPDQRDTISQKLGYALQPKVTRQSARTISVLQALSDFARNGDLDVVLDAVK